MATLECKSLPLATGRRGAKPPLETYLNGNAYCIRTLINLMSLQFVLRLCMFRPPGKGGLELLKFKSFFVNLEFIMDGFQRLDLMLV